MSIKGLKPETIYNLRIDYKTGFKWDNGNKSPFLPDYFIER